MLHCEENNDECNVLQREHRNMESNRKAFAEECNLILTRQKKKIETVKFENETLKADISLLQAKTNLRNNNSNTATFEQSLTDKLYLEIEKYTASIENEKNVVTNSEKQISNIRTQIRCKRKSLIKGGSSSSPANNNNIFCSVRENQRSVEMKFRLLENGLDQSLLKFNKLISYNKKERHEIDDLRGERSVFEEIYNKLEKNLQEKKKQMARVIEESNLSYEQRDQAQAEILAMEQSNLKEQEVFEQQMKTLKEELNNNLAKALSSTSATTLIEKEETEREESSNVNTVESQTTVISKVTGNNEILDSTTQEQLQNLEQAFFRISSIIEVSDTNEIVDTFLANEEQNFSLLTFANEQVDQINRLQAQVQALREEEARHNRKNGNDADQYEIHLIELEDKIECSNTQKEKYMDKCMENQKTLDKLKSVLSNLLNNLGCMDKMTEDSQITEANMLYYFGILEKKAHELLTSYRYYYEALDCHKQNPHHQELQSKSTLPSLDIVFESKLDVIPPKISDYSSDDDDEDEAKPIGENSIRLSARTRRSLFTKDLKSKSEIVKIMPESGRNEFNRRVAMLRKKSSLSNLENTNNIIDSRNKQQQQQKQTLLSEKGKAPKSFLVPLVQK